ncbi:hypothetical protein B7H23_02805 [Notoacmeibacter marinus]|uniref:Uncharacterized protein n=1 Tax=Notoacmeibacter marinus TaxID=1876515 RepID=A0A231V125_9HYPH|nr:hypothetical protein B7H23_02805 [Notoacmeibacter marinus]
MCAKDRQRKAAVAEGCHGGVLLSGDQREGDAIFRRVVRETGDRSLDPDGGALTSPTIDN